MHHPLCGLTTEPMAYVFSLLCRVSLRLLLNPNVHTIPYQKSHIFRRSIHIQDPALALNGARVASFSLISHNRHFVENYEVRTWDGV
jgi:hypothetical protein